MVGVVEPAARVAALGRAEVMAVEEAERGKSSAQGTLVWAHWEAEVAEAVAMATAGVVFVGKVKVRELPEATAALVVGRGSVVEVVRVVEVARAMEVGMVEGQAATAVRVMG